MITADQLAAALQDEASVVELIFPEDGSRSDRIDIDQSWHGLHYLLAGDPYAGTGPLAMAILGGTAIGHDLSYGPVRYLTVEQVAEVALALASCEEPELTARFDPEAMQAHDIYPGIWSDGAHALQYLLQGFRSIRDHYQSAANRGDAMLQYIA